MRILPTSLFALLLSGLHYCVIAGNPSAAVSSDSTSAFPDSTLAAQSDTALTQPRTEQLTQDSVAAQDTSGIVRVPPYAGALDGSFDSSLSITKADINWLDYRYLGGILEYFPGVYVRGQNGAGQYDQLNIQGVDWRSIAILSNGRPLNDPVNGTYNLYYYTPEYVDRLEIVTGPRAFLYGFNGAGGVVNALTRNVDNYKPYTKLRYAETAYEYQYSDGTFRQNIFRGTNFTLGYQHQGTDGRFTNSAHDAWNFRLKLRHRLSNAFTIIASEYLTSTRTNLNGGAHPASAQTLRAFDPLRAVMRNTDSYEKTNRHDVDLSMVGTLLGDTTNLSVATLYYSRNFREYRDEENRSSPNGILIHSDHISSWMGMTLTQNYHTDLQRFDVGAAFEIRQIEGSPNMGRRRNVLTSGWLKEEIFIAHDLTLSGFARFDHYRARGHLGAGADATAKLSATVSAFAGVSFSRRLPTYQEEFWTDSTVTRPSPIREEKHRQIEAGVRAHLGETFDLHAAVFQRKISDAIRLTPYTGDFVFPGVTFSNVDELETRGIEVRTRARVWYFLFEGNATYLMQKTGDDEELEELPQLVASGGAYFWSELFNHNLGLKVGFRGRYSSAQLGQEFNPEMLVYVTNAHQRIGRSGTVDFVLIARMGDAHLHFVWENLTNVQSFSSPFFPVLDRAIRFGLAWEFND